jgi:hypothetical protein
MRAVARIIFIVLALVAVAATSPAQSSEQETKEGTATITGRVTADGKPAAGFVVTFARIDSKRERSMDALFQREPQLKALTDHDGRYRLTGLQAGRYRVTPFAPAHTATGADQENMLSLADGETIENIDFALARGGVITGRVTKADGRPIIGEAVVFTLMPDSKKPELKDEDDDKNEDASTFSMFGGADFKTDDRGVYRIYGLPPGRYLLSVGAGGRPMEVKQRYNSATFYPGVTDKAKATLVEVPPGGEVAGIDIKLGLPSQTFRATGRVIDVETDKPVPNVVITSGPLRERQSSVSVTSATGLSNEKGEFRIEGVMPGKHLAFASFRFEGQGEFYSDRTVFEIKSEDVAGLVIKVRRGLRVSGIAVVEGTSKTSVSQLELMAVSSSEDGASGFSRSKITPDGSFQFRGLSPGKVQVMISYYSEERKFAIARLERGGVEQKEYIELDPGEQVTDLRVVLSYASASLRGLVKIEGGTLPKDTYLTVSAFRKGQHDREGTMTIPVDMSGRFEFEELIPGEYEITLEVYVIGNRDAPLQTVMQTVTVAPDAETQVTIVYDPSRKEKNK